ncbi:tetratricopeptide repeat protein [Mucilaginibacter segetis]|uniref:Tetratricopeptide repeat protein n=1 Tax=Mucilaginibacter segetis TaxID=2793071 RepID=A0A934UMX8_9SPHI|nr:hypothetical protein [Mucilaginibacter segetis]MBK0379839.1 hypothetical protein [Mucilaginibacter segetis]
MKMISKTSKIVLMLLFLGSSVFAQSLDDAKKAIDAEQYQKAKSMLKNLTTTQSNKDENFFYLGWVYILQDYPDSAKMQFNKGIAVEEKSALNYAGLGVVALIDKDKATANTDFNKAMDLAKKDVEPYIYIAKGYLLSPVDGKIPAADANAAIAVLNKAKEVKNSDKSTGLYLTLGDAYRSQLKNTEAYEAYLAALNIDPKLPAAKVATGVLWKYADNFQDSETQFKQALEIDPNYGPAYREWAETDVRWANTDPKMASEKIKEGTDHYRKYLSLTDMSVESEMRYADFLIQSGDFKTLQQVATDLSKTANGNLRAYRYLAYAGYENGDYPAGLNAINTWLSKADPKRIIARDYLYLGRLEIKTNKDSLGILALRKAYQMDSTQADVFQEIGKTYYDQKKYEKAGDAYSNYVEKSKNATLNDYLAEGRSYYFAYEDQYFSKATPKPTPDSTLLTKADSAFAHIQSKVAKPIPAVTIYQARVAEYKETDRNNIKGLARPYYEQYIELISAKPNPSEYDKRNLAEAYAYMGGIYELIEKDDAKALEAYTKAREADPTNKRAQYYFDRKAAAGKSK